MERLTEKAPRPSVNSQYVKRKGFYTADCIERLGIYEDTGLTPPEIMELKERDTEKTPVEITAHPSYIKHFVCPRCNSGVHYMFRFCPVCGQRLKQED